MKTVVFKDRVILNVIAGSGGDGLSSFRREKYVPRGGPDGGDGGRGGHVILEASKDVDSLLPLYFRPHQKAEPGGRGGKQRAHGRNGQDRVIAVPCGTIAYDEASGDLIGEVLEHGDRLRIARGGRGGKGNCHWVTATNQAPTDSTAGTAGEGKRLRLDLKLVADVGLVGYPNAGKSTLLRSMTHAHPKVASYPFTTLNPLIGTLIFDDYSQIRIADIPGLIEGAAEGVGLGHDFLRHIERTSFLVFVIDMGATDGRDPIADYRNLRHELGAYRAELNDRPFLVVANKMDAPGADDNLQAFQDELGVEVLPAIAELDEGVDRIKHALFERAREIS